ncbi:MAG: arginine--tRNA ligase [Clostridiales bacterium]|jgi:arginyl-tRNA synthetase|nr:arginine--tRNA ligase [Clostridiales bacterium]
MSNEYFFNTIIGKRKSRIVSGIHAALSAAQIEKKIDFRQLPPILLEVPKEEAHGDFACTIAMLLAKELKRSPREIAGLIKNYFDCAATGVEKLDIAGPGFLNFYLPKSWLSPCLSELLAEGDDFGRSEAGSGKKVQVEFVSANPTGELHMGNARGAAIGDTLASLLDMSGHQVEREFYINDAGNQISRFAASLEARYLQLLGQDAQLPDDGYHGQDICDTMAALIKEEGNKYLGMESHLRKEYFTSYALQEKITNAKKTLEKFGVVYDVWFSEQSLHDSGSVTDIIERLRQGGWVYEQDGAFWLASTRFGEEKDEVLVRANGIPTYYAADIAYHDNKFQRGFGLAIDIWGADHHGHVARMKGAMAALGYSRDQLEVVLMQLVHLYQGGELLLMSKRAGTYVTLEELMETVGKDAARFFFVMRSAGSQMDFDLDLAKKQSADNPVYYVQYAHARICSMLAKAAEEGYTLKDLPDDFSLLDHPSELALIRKLVDFPDEIIFAAQHFEPHRIAIYVQDLAALFHNFYSHCRVVGPDKDLSLARLWLAKGTARVIANALKAMGVSAPEKM